MERDHDRHGDPWPPRRIPHQMGPVHAVIAGSQVLGGGTGPLLELRLNVRLNDIPPDQRRPLAGLLHSGDRLTLTLDTAGGATVLKRLKACTPLAAARGNPS